VVACVLHTQADGAVSAQVRTVSTMTADLAALSGWLRAQGVECVALESTGVFWWPVFNLLEEQGHRVVLVNAAHMKAIPGHKTDIADSKWLADLLRHGLLRPSFIPPAPIRALRELVRQRTTLVQQRAQETNRLQKVLEGANIKLANVATDILGASGRAMLEAIAQGEEQAEVLAELAQGRLRAKLPALLDHIAALEATIAALDEEVALAVAPFEPAVTLLLSLPGVTRLAAAALMAEIGVDISQPRQDPRRTRSRGDSGHYGRRSDAFPLWADASAPRCHHKEDPRAGLRRRPRG